MATLRGNIWVSLATLTVLVGAVLVVLGLTVAPMWLVWLGFGLILLALCLWPLVGLRRKRLESVEDVALNERTGSARATGGVPRDGAADQHSTTSPNHNDLFVGRVAGEDPGADEVSGAEQRASLREQDEPPHR